MARQTIAGTIQEAVAEAYQAAGGLKRVSELTGVSLGTLSYATSGDEDRPAGLGVNHLDRLGREVPGAALREVDESIEAQTNLRAALMLRMDELRRARAVQRSIPIMGVVR